MNWIFLILSVAGVPVSIAGGLLHWNPILMFFIYCLTIIGLANYIGKGTESLAVVVGSTLGGLLNVTFGNAVELIISILALREGLTDVVLASLTGSVISNLLLVGGLSIFTGGLKFKRQKFNEHSAQHNGGLLIFGIIVAFVFPFIFSLKTDDHKTQLLSAVVAVIMIIIYLAALLFKLVTHRGVYTSEYDSGSDEEEETPEYGTWKAIIILGVATLAVAYISEKLVGAIEPVGKALGWSDLFIGVIIVAIVGNAAEHSSAVWMAIKNKMDVTIEIAMGSSLQIAMFVGPILVLISFATQEFMPLIFSLPELVSMVLAVIITIAITNDGDTNWFEGAILTASYLIMGFGFYIL